MTETPPGSFEQFMARRLAASTAFVEGDVGPLIDISAAASPATIFGPAGTAVQGWEQVNAANSAGSQSFEPGGSNTFDVMHHAADGGIAYWVGVQRSVVHLRGKAEPAPMELRVTEIFRWEDGDGSSSIDTPIHCTPSEAGFVGATRRPQGWTDGSG